MVHTLSGSARSTRTALVGGVVALLAAVGLAPALAPVVSAPLGYGDSYVAASQPLGYGDNYSLPPQDAATPSRPAV